MKEVLVLEVRQVERAVKYLKTHSNNKFSYVDKISKYWGCGHNKRVAPLLSPKQYSGHNALGKLRIEIMEEQDQPLGRI